MSTTKSPSYKSNRGKGRKSSGVSFKAPTIPAHLGITDPATERESLLTKIEKEKAFIAKYSNYPADCERAAARITFCEKRLIEIELQAEAEKESAEFIKSIFTSLGTEVNHGR